jgi:hypothetical protein
MFRPTQGHHLRGFMQNSTGSANSVEDVHV